MSDTPETMIGLFAKQLNAKLADDYRAMHAENERLRAAFLNYVREDNKCNQYSHFNNQCTSANCGCLLEMQSYIDSVK
jgi:hypothetical protein